jgi:hypothetical protein
MRIADKIRNLLHEPLPFPGFWPATVVPEPTGAEITLLQQPPMTPEQIAVATVALMRPVPFTPEVGKDSLFTQSKQVVAPHIGNVAHRILQPDPQRGNKWGKRH